MNANFGILPALGVKARKGDRKRLYAERALRQMCEWKGWLLEKADFFDTSVVDIVVKSRLPGGNRDPV